MKLLPLKDKPATKGPLEQIQDEPDLPRVLIIGDSISIGYTIPVREILENFANVHRPPANCASTKHGLKSINKWLGNQPNRTKNKSNIYDLNKFFSKKLWIKSETSDFYEEYLKKLEEYLKAYLKMMAKPQREYSVEEQTAYDKHLAGTDPAYGILKNYYDKEFAEKYINTFLFDLATR